MQYNPRTKLWTEIVKQDPQAQTITRKLDRWVAISSCLESIHGSGGYLSRYVIFYIHATVENQIGVASGLPPVFYYLTGGLNVSLGIKAGMSKLLTLLFSCAINPGEIAQFLIRPKYVLIPNMKTIMYKFKGKKLHKVRVEYIKSFKMLSIDTPEHQCWVSRNIADLQCSAQISEDVHIEL
ncbi:hypothetical protein KGF56_001158 [Candida oxycetoniae]|uniref:Uncharacterized protein n=1 Tax=Candida oxycetoniae TaxID=497107 RepID=A0AAI9T059_9ASCO|nr:uncharacterized protein KGF56_001158 [Candida oxycetoniae]KAI3405939.2 hypothetical protein KGF56_001158 [Candida oxycetoniae]